MNGLLAIGDLDGDTVSELLVLAREPDALPSLRGRTVASVFFESSTRTRLSFETAARRLSATVLSFTPTTSSATKGESLRDTVRTVEAMGVDAIVLRHARAGAATRAAGWCRCVVVNAGDGAHEHPTQALVDRFTLAEALGAWGASALEGLRVAIIGDIAHSRVARSCVAAFGAGGAHVTLVAPPTLLPPGVGTWPVEVRADLDDVLPKTDVAYVLRLQRERMDGPLLPGAREYADRYGMTAERLGLLGSGGLVMHPGPMIRGLEISDEVADDPRCLAARQAANGVPVRMAVLARLLGARPSEVAHG